MEVLFAILALLVCLALIIGAVAAFSLAWYGNIVTKVPYVPSPRYIRKFVMELMPLTSDSIFYDLGAGDGGFAHLMARSYPVARVVGVEKAPLPKLFFRLRIFLSRRSNLHLVGRDFKELDLGDATHIYTYLFPGVLDELLPKLERELRPGTRLVSCDFAFSHKEPIQRVSVKNCTLYIYQF